jgi:uncharacterized membrane protein
MEKDKRIKKDQPQEEISVTRLNAFSDGVFAVAITLLILNIDIPEIAHNLVNTQLPTILIAMKPKFLAFVFSFIMVGIYWMVHHNIFHLIKRHSQVLSWLNLLLLMCIVFLPFSTGLLSEYNNIQLTTIIYAINLGVIGILIYTIWGYATYNHRLVDKNLSSELIQHIKMKCLIVPLVALIVIIVSFFNFIVASYCWFLILIINFYLEGKHHHLKKERGY